MSNSQKYTLNHLSESKNEADTLFLGIPKDGIAQDFAELHATVLVMRATVLVLHEIVRNCYNCVELRRIASKLRACNCAQVTCHPIALDTLVPVSTRIL